MSLNLQYFRELRKEFDYCSTWLPNVKVRLGEIGRLGRDGYEHIAYLEDFDLDFSPRTDRGSSDLRYASRGSVRLSVKNAGEGPVAGSELTQAEAGIRVSFSSENAVLFQASGCSTMSIDDQYTLGRKILALFESGRWPQDCVVVTDIVSAKWATILISSSSEAEAEFTGSASVQLCEFSLADAHAEIKLKTSRNIGMQVVAERGLTPLFRAKGIHKKLFSRPDFKKRSRPGRESSGVPLPAPAFLEMTYDTFLEG